MSAQAIATLLERHLLMTKRLAEIAQRLRDDAAAGSVSVLEIARVYQRIHEVRDALSPTIARDTSNGGSWDLQAVLDSNLVEGPADVLSMWSGGMTAGASVLAEVESLLPGSGSDTSKPQQMWVEGTGSSGEIAYRQYSVSETEALRTALTSLVSALTY